MSVQNPERVVTKQDLADFYGQILPYLGGMPEILANKFSKGDMYSTDEKMIGQWIDGKPLYQKTKTMTIGNSSGWQTFAHGISDIDTVIESHGFIKYSNEFYNLPHCTSTSGASMGVTATGTYIYIQAPSKSGAPAAVTLTYTKSTDSPISIGSDTDYSTDEKIVGTWIDGKPIWQKTINFGALPNNTSKSVAHNISNISTVCNIYGIGVGSNIYQPFPILNDATPNKSVALWCDNTNVTVRATNEDYSAMVGYITIQYVKATS